MKEVKKADPPMYDESSDVVILTDENFEDVVLKDGLPWVVEFYAPWCGEYPRHTHTRTGHLSICFRLVRSLQRDED